MMILSLSSGLGSSGMAKDHETKGPGFKSSFILIVKRFLKICSGITRVKNTDTKGPFSSPVLPEGHSALDKAVNRTKDHWVLIYTQLFVL